MDERKLEELFRDAVQSVPPASFDEADVARGARRVTARRRTAAAGGSVVAAAALFVGVGVGTGMFGGQESQLASTPETPEVRTENVPKTNGPIVMGDPNSRSGCGTPDSALAGALAAELPEAAGRPSVPASGPCPSGSKSAGFAVSEGPAAGNVSVILSPASAVAPEQAKPTEVRRPDGTEQVVRHAGSGDVLTVRSDPDGATAAPFGARLVAIADGLAPRL
ncbi:hypothetical protein [Saccharopolyspora taberi]|uniref:Uncharacterized protein n=1 Tax=Saccharopolyspora taberi TaxID=60895 RepID=A0ABN3VLS9_9PSEU